MKLKLNNYTDENISKIKDIIKNNDSINIELSLKLMKLIFLFQEIDNIEEEHSFLWSCVFEDYIIFNKQKEKENIIYDILETVESEMGSPFDLVKNYPEIEKNISEDLIKLDDFFKTKFIKNKNQIDSQINELKKDGFEIYFDYSKLKKLTYIDNFFKK